MKCAGCLKPIRDNAGISKCTSTACEKIFCSVCINAPILTVERKIWKCPECNAAQKKGGDNSLTPVRGGSENITTRKKQDSVGSEITQLTEQLRLLTSELCSVKTKLNDLTQSISYTNERMDISQPPMRK
ncbi:unnamed protein product [Parnassius apollo]|uniref:(apollo) hypothetical protein n=1 Tax=Parnassius apollo TaxID=110799 RepID=A0A8S3X5X6_PARAO|nr:unnamed protein product [Parnassius apollo]